MVSIKGYSLSNITVFLGHEMEKCSQAYLCYSGQKKLFISECGWGGEMRVIELADGKWQNRATQAYKDFVRENGKIFSSFLPNEFGGVEDLSIDDLFYDLLLLEDLQKTFKSAQRKNQVLFFADGVEPFKYLTCRVQKNLQAEEKCIERLQAQGYTNIRIFSKEEDFIF